VSTDDPRPRIKSGVFQQYGPIHGYCTGSILIGPSAAVMELFSENQYSLDFTIDRDEYSATING